MNMPTVKICQPMHIKKHSYQKNLFFLLILFLAYMIPVHGLDKKYTHPAREIKDMNNETRKEKGGTYITLSRGVTHYEITGPEDGDVVVLIHGMALAMWVWDRQIKTLTDAGFRVLRYNHYGRGYSDYPRMKYNREVYRLQLLELLDSLNMQKPVHIICHSFGGKIASYFTSWHPERVNKIIFIAPGVKLNKLFIACMRSVFGRKIIHRRFDKLPGTIEKDLKSENIPIIPYKKIYLDQIKNRGFEASFASLLGYAVGDYRKYYKEAGKNNRNVMLIWGNKDTNAKRKHIRMAQRAIPHIDFRIINGIGHVPQFAATEELNIMLKDFLLH